MNLARATEVFIPSEHLDFARATLQSYRQIPERLEGEQHVFRIVDVAPGFGAFACFAAMRWMYAFIDCYVTDPELEPVLRLNTQPCTRFFKGRPEPVPKCDMLHVGLGAGTLSFDGGNLAELKVALWEFDSDERFEKAAGFFRAIGLSLAHVATTMRGPGIKGWQLWIREVGSQAPSFTFDMTRKKSEPAEVSR